MQIGRRKRKVESSEATLAHGVASKSHSFESIPIAPGDPLEIALLSAGGPIDVAALDLESDALKALREAGVELMVPLIGQGELLGALYLGHRLSDQPYSTDDRRLLGNLAQQVAPAMRVAQLVREQQAEAKERERIQQELEVAALIQQTLLPKELPSIPGWHIDAFYRPARAVGGDFYDFINLGADKLGVVIGDVTDKGVPAAMVMATCRSTLRAAALQYSTPSQVLGAVNDALVKDIPPAMFVTCLYAILDTRAGKVVMANAGHNLPYVRNQTGITELRATGMPLGLMEGMPYEETTHALEDGDVMVLTSDGITEAHNASREMYGFPRLMDKVASKAEGSDLIASLVGDLENWTGDEVEQEDDITLVVVRRIASAQGSAGAFQQKAPELLDAFAIPSIEGSERVAIDRVTEVVSPLGLDERKLERLKTAVGETVMNAIEHGNKNDASLSVDVEVATTDSSVHVIVRDQGGGGDIPTPETPDLEAKLTGQQTPRGWGLFLIEKMVDEVRSDKRDGRHTVELVMNREGGS